MQSIPSISPEPSHLEYVFGLFRLIPRRHLLMRGDEPVRISSRALDILILLAERHGELVSHREIISRIWPRKIVELNNLKVHVATLRSILGDGKRGERYIATVHGRGYQLVAPVVSHPGMGTDAVASTADQRHSLPSISNPILGRTEDIGVVQGMLNRTRLVSIVGTAGIGKTVTALAIADSVFRQSATDAWFIDLSELRDDSLVPTTVAAALGLPHIGESQIPVLIARLRERPCLLVFDNCEHVLAGTVAMIEHIRSGAPDTSVLVTSREALCCAGEHVFRLPPLPHPPAGARLSAAEALDYPAVQLFAERATERRHDYQLNDADTPAVIEICRRLDGVPLAIELAATRIEAFSAHEIAAGLRSGLDWFNWARRGTQPRHNTFAAALDWSYDFLSPEEQRLLRSLAVFRDIFTLEDVLALCGGNTPNVAEVIAKLVAKSLICTAACGVRTRYHLLQTGKAYALHKLELAGELAGMQRRHAMNQCQILPAAAPTSLHRLVLLQPVRTLDWPRPPISAPASQRMD